MMSQAVCPCTDHAHLQASSSEQGCSHKTIMAGSNDDDISWCISGPCPGHRRERALHLICTASHEGGPHVVTKAQVVIQSLSEGKIVSSAARASMDTCWSGWWLHCKPDGLSQERKAILAFVDRYMPGLVICVCS